MADVIAGAFREGLSGMVEQFVKSAEQRRAAGFSQYGWEATVVELLDLLDGYDILVEELLLSAREKPGRKSKDDE